MQNAGEEGEKGETATEAKESEAQPVVVQYKKELNRCREVDRSYKKLNKIDEGTYGVVYRAEYACALDDEAVLTCSPCAAGVRYPRGSWL